MPGDITRRSYISVLPPAVFKVRRAGSISVTESCITFTPWRLCSAP
jgi:hypothetical protein